MASIKVKFRPSTASGREGSIYYQVIHGRIVRQVKTDYRIFDTEWDKRTSSMKILSEIGENRKRYLREVAEHIDWDTRRLKAIVVQCDRQGGIYSADSIVEKFNGQTGEQSLFRFTQGIIGQLKQLGKVRTSETYTAALASFMKFREGQDSKYSINSLVYWVTYVHNVVYSFYRSMIYCYINSTQRCAGSIVIDIIPTNGADKRKFFPFAPYFPVTNVIKRYFYPYFPAIIGIKGYSFPYFPYLSGIMKIKTALYSLFSRLDWHKTVVFPCLGEIYEGIRSLSWEIPVT